MGTTAPGPVHLLQLCDQKLMEFACKADTHFVWLKEIQEEARRMFTREFIKEPELMPKTPSQKNRGKKRKIANIQDANRKHIRKSPEEDPGKEAEPMEEAGPEVPKNEESTLWPRGAPKTVISMPGSQPAAGGQDKLPVGQQEAKIHQTDGPEEPPQSIRRKQSCRRRLNNKEAVMSELDGELQLPRSKTPSPPCPASKVVQPVRTFLHTMQRNQMLMTPTSASRSRVIKSFVKRNTPLRVDPKEKEQQRLENLRRKEEAEQLRRLKVEEDKRRRLEELKLKREERLRKVLQARERAEQMREEKIKQMEQRIAPQEKNEKAKEERLAEEKAKKMAAAKKMEVRRKQEAARRLRCLQQEEEEDEQERLLKAAEARRLAEQREQEQRREQERLQAERELQEREKALRLQKERLQRELEEKKKEKQQRLQEEQEKKAKEATAASKGPNTTMDVQSPACTSYQMTPQGPRAPPKINLDNYGMDLNSDDSTDDESHPRKPVPSWATGTQLSQAILHQYCHPPNLPELFGTIRQLDLEDIFKKSKPRYHKRTSSAVWNSPPLQGGRVPSSLTCSLKY
ncbi:PREDICTED: LOW QUALITY PROTEIN: inner centromere protein-like [Myotis brandtii]|uniref:LOW QUALITY PROTEIN: inner centromere protein-like n=1 Tax=Myotis brandtii TaxID=109478 RepID=UPI000703EDE8|nr:PREDICTED: LOW QUALITY PROTEIN: inner centromere protein-like [Myotis brandtii]